MPIEDQKARETHPEIIELAKEIALHEERHSEMKAESVKQLGKILDKYGGRNEDTFLRKFWSKLIKEERDVQDTEVTDLNPAAWEKKTWDVSNLDDNWNREFRKGSIPEVDVTDDSTLKLLNSCERVKNPKPDVAYGLDNDAFTDTEIAINRLNLPIADISPGIWYPGLIVEGKTAGIIQLVECQCARGGAALVNATRELIHKSGASVYSPGADLQSQVFSIALVPDYAKLFVHWAEVTKDQTTKFHMHRLRSYALEEDDQLARLRHDINNVLDWITLKRKTWLQEILAVIRTGIENKKRPVETGVIDDEPEVNTDDDLTSVSAGEGMKPVSVEEDEVAEDLDIDQGLRRSKRPRIPKKW